LSVKGSGGVLSVRRKTSSRVNSLTNEIDLPDQALTDLYAVAGELVINWGMVEASLNTLINTLYKEYGGDVLEGKEQTIPVPFGRRIKYIKACFKGKGPLALYVEEARTVRSRAKQLSFVRDYIAHGYLHDYDRKTGVYTFGRLDTDEEDTVHVHTTFAATAVELMDYSGQMMKLFDLSHALVNKLFPAKL
jgi:hypothetical protein